MSTIETETTDVSITEKIADHAVDGLCAIGIVASIYLGGADPTTVGGFVSIALGKRVLKK